MVRRSSYLVEIVGLLLVATGLLPGCGTTSSRTRQTTGSAVNNPNVFPHPPGWEKIEGHGLAALDENVQLAVEKCDGCHDIQGTATEGAAGCKSCHSNYPHPEGWGETSIHVSSLGVQPTLLKGSIQQNCATGCHGTDLGGGLSSISCDKCHTGYPHPLGWSTNSHGLAIFKDSKTQLPACGSCHGADYKGGVFSPSCLGCHSIPGQVGKIQHSPVRAGTCDGCHVGSLADAKGPHLTRAEGATLCSSCHSSVLASTTYKHSAVTAGEACSTCHDPHESNFPALLKVTQTDTCFTCHNRELTSAAYGTTRNIQGLFTSSSNRHDPFQAGDCGACHNTHGSNNNHLLDKNEAMFWLPANANLSAYSCFSCHDYSTYVSTPTFARPSPATRPSSKLPTQFVELESSSATNLHWLHVIAVGASCHSCHDPHAANNQYLMRSYISYNEPGTAFWSFSKCAGCHTETYPAGYPSTLW